MPPSGFLIVREVAHQFAGGLRRIEQPLLAIGAPALVEFAELDQQHARSPPSATAVVDRCCGSRPGRSSVISLRRSSKAPMPAWRTTADGAAVDEQSRERLPGTSFWEISKSCSAAWFRKTVLPAASSTTTALARRSSPSSLERSRRRGFRAGCADDARVPIAVSPGSRRARGGSRRCASERPMSSPGRAPGRGTSGSCARRRVDRARRSCRPPSARPGASLPS